MWIIMIWHEIGHLPNCSLKRMLSRWTFTGPFFAKSEYKKQRIALETVLATNHLPAYQSSSLVFTFAYIHVSNHKLLADYT